MTPEYMCFICLMLNNDICKYLSHPECVHFQPSRGFQISFYKSLPSQINGSFITTPPHTPNTGYIPYSSCTVKWPESKLPQKYLCKPHPDWHHFYKILSETKIKVLLQVFLKKNKIWKKPSIMEHWILLPDQMTIMLLLFKNNIHFI